MTDIPIPSHLAIETDDAPRIYVACLAAYHNGKLHGAWIDATLEPDAIIAEVQALLAVSPEPDAEVWVILDHEGFHGLRLSKWDGFVEIHAYAAFIAEHGQLGALLLAHVDKDVEIAQALMADGYAGCYGCLAAFAEELTEDTTTIPENLRYYIDYERMATDMEISGDILTIQLNWEVHIFWHH